MSQQAQAPSTTAVASPISARSGSVGSTLTTMPAAPLPQVHATAELMAKMRESLDSYSDAIDSIGKQVISMVQDGSDSDSQVTAKIPILRRHLEAQDKKQDEQIAQIRVLMQEVLERDVVEHLTSLIEAGVMQEIDALVDAEVVRLLPEYMPQHLQDELREHQRQLEEVQKALYNSESRRANSTLRTHRLHEAVHDLYNVSGEKSSDFPRTLGEMFAISNERAVSLMNEYGVGEPSTSRERNINRLMQSFGIQYQL